MTASLNRLPSLSAHCLALCLTDYCCCSQPTVSLVYLSSSYLTVYLNVCWLSHCLLTAWLATLTVYFTVCLTYWLPSVFTSLATPGNHWNLSHSVSSNLNVLQRVLDPMTLPVTAFARETFFFFLVKPTQGWILSVHFLWGDCPRLSSMPGRF